MKYLHIFIIVILPYTITGCDNCSSWTSTAISQSEQIGNNIIFRLQSFKAASGRLPATLDEMERHDSVPIDNPVAGTGKWSYYVRSDGSFLLSFHCKDEYPIQYWDSRQGVWVLDQ